MKYKCLIVDHDDTAVNSTPYIHYPAYIEAMKILRPDKKILNLDDYFRINFDPGLGNFLRYDLDLNDDEMIEEYNIWRSFTTNRIPDFFDGFIDLINEFKRNGGIIVVASHSEKELIERDYKNVSDFIPDLIFGWDFDENRRKPSAYPVTETMRMFNLKAEDIFIIDDLKPGLLMAQKCSVGFGAVGWAHKIPEIVKYMRKESLVYFDSIDEFQYYIFG